MQSQYNIDKMDSDLIQLRNPRLLNLTIYAILLIMVIIGLITLPSSLSKVLATALCLAFGLLNGFGLRGAAGLGRLAAYFTLQTIIVLGLLRLSFPSDIFNLLFYVLALQAALILPLRTATFWIAGFYLLDSLSAILSRGAAAIPAVLFYGAAFMMTGVFGYSLRQTEIARRRNQQLLEELQATQRQLQEMAVVEERNRLAREMHDSLGHRLTVAVVQLEGAQRLIPTDPERAGRMINTMRDEMKEALAELRRTVSALRAPVMDDLSLETALSNLAQGFEQHTGIPTHCSIPAGFPDLPEAYRMALYRAVQESLTNIQRHAAAHNAWLQLSVNDQRVTLTMSDDGRGIDLHQTNQAGSGLRGLGERAAQLGGQLQLSERPGGGTQLVFSVPLPKTGANS